MGAITGINLSVGNTASIAAFDVDATVNLAPGALFAHWFYNTTLDAGAAPYTLKLELATTGVYSGAIWRIMLVLAASTNPMVEVYNDTIAGTLLQSVTGTADAATTFLFEGFFKDTAWIKYDGRYVI